MSFKKDKPATISFRTTKNLKHAAEQLAAGQYRSLSSLVNEALADYLKQKGKIND